MIKKIKKKILHLREDALILLWHLMEYLDLIGTTISTILIAFLFSGCILIANAVYIECKENISIAFQVFLLVAPFLIGLAFEYWFCKCQYNKLLLADLENDFLDMLCNKFSDVMEFLVVVGIAFLVFLKSSLYTALELNATQKLTSDIFAGWLVSACVVVRITFASAHNVRQTQQKAISKKSITEQRRSQRIIIYTKRIYCNQNGRKIQPNLSISLFGKMRKFLIINKKNKYSTNNRQP